MSSQLWKNQISNNLKQAMLKEVETHLKEDVKEIRQANKRLVSDNRHKSQLIKRLKRTLAEIQGVEVHQIKILKEVQ